MLGLAVPSGGKIPKNSLLISFFIPGTSWTLVTAVPGSSSVSTHCRAE